MLFSFLLLAEAMPLTATRWQDGHGAGPHCIVEDVELSIDADRASATVVLNIDGHVTVVDPPKH